MKNQEHAPIYRQDYQVPPYLIDSIHLTFQLYDASAEVIAKMEIRKNPKSNENGDVLRLDGDELKLRAIKYNDAVLPKDRFEVSEKELSIVAADEQFTLELTTRLDPDNNTALQGLYRSSGNFCTQCEAEGFRRITYFLDRPDVLARFTTRIEADKASCPVLLANGNKIEEGDLDGGRHYALWQDPYPKPSYLFAMVAGNLVHIEDNHVTRSGREVCLRIYVQERNIDKCDHAMRSLKKAMVWDEEVYGLEYDLDVFMIVAVDDFNMGAMENKGLNVFNSKYVLASPQTATDNDYIGIEGVVAHEYFHNWTGNRVTCRDWFQLSLKEGLTVFRDQEFSADMNSRAEQRIDDVRILRTSQFREDAGPMAHPVRPDSYMEINNFYTVTVYNKGAEVIRMMHTLLGAEGFRRGMDLYFARHDGQAVTCDDFVAAMSDANDYDLEQFKLWYSQSGTPELSVQEAYDQAKQEYALTVSQTCPPTPAQETKKAFHIPIAIGLLDRQGREINVTGDASMVLELKEEKETFLFKGIEEKPVLSFLRDFSAPVKVKPFQSREELAFLMANDPNLYNRWEAATRLAEQIIFDAVAALRSCEQPVLDEAYVKAVAGAIADGDRDKALLAQALHLPTEIYLAGQMEEIDPDNLHLARNFVRRELAARLNSEFVHLYRGNREEGEYALDPQAMGRRSLKNTALGYLMTCEPPAGQTVDDCLDQYRRGANMTDVIAALQCIANTDLDIRREILDDFQRKWRHDPLVMDKWFILQATSRLEGTLDEVKALMDNPSFSIKNPNKVRSLIGAFCSMNHYRFHDSGGAGYAFLADRIIQLNRINGQIAARLVSPLTTWKKYDGERQRLMRDQLERIASLPDLSRDVFEVVKKCM